MCFHSNLFKPKNYSITYKPNDFSHDMLTVLELLLYQNPGETLWLTVVNYKNSGHFAKISVGKE